MRRVEEGEEVPYKSFGRIKIGFGVWAERYKMPLWGRFIFDLHNADINNKLYSLIGWKTKWFGIYASWDRKQYVFPVSEDNLKALDLEA